MRNNNSEIEIIKFLNSKFNLKHKNRGIKYEKSKRLILTDKYTTLFNIRRKTPLGFKFLKLLKVKNNNLLIFKDTVTIESLNGYVFLNIKENLFIKVIENKFNNSVSKNFDLVTKFYSNLVIEELKLMESDNFTFIYSHFLDHKLLQEHQEDYRKSLNKALSINSENIEEVSFSEYYKMITKNLQIERTSPQLNEIRLELISQLKEFQNTNRSVFLKFSHGDLSANNFMFTKNKIYLIDWENSGIFNFIYDYIVLEFYSSDFTFWEKVSKNVFDFRYSSILEENIRDLKKFDSDIKINQSDIYLSLIELFILNINRYDNNKDIDEGVQFLSKIIKIVKILND